MTPAELARGAQAALGAGRYAVARRLARALVASLPDHVPSHLGLAKLLSDPDHAAVACRRAIRLQPDRVEGWGALAAASIRGRRWTVAGWAAQRALALHPGHGGAWQALATALRRQRAPAAALRSAGRALAARPGDDAASACRVDCLMALGRGDDAVAAYREATGRPAMLARDARLDDLFGRGADQLVAFARPRRCVWSGDSRAHFALVPRAARLPRALLMAEKWALLVDDRLLIEETNHNPGEVIEELGCVKAWSGGRYLVDLDRPVDRIDGPALLVGGNSNYYHWLVDYLPRLAIHDLMGLDGSAAVLLATDLPAAAVETLDLLGIAAARRRTLPRGRLHDCHDLVVAALPSRYGFTHPWALDFLRSRLQGTRRPQGRRRLYVARSDAQHRRVVNEPEVSQVLAARGIETVLLGGMGFAAQRDLFAEADLVVGVHGAGLANLVFAPPQARVLELASAVYRANYFPNLAATAGISLRQQVIAAHGPRHIPPSRWPVTIDTAGLAAAIDRWDAER
jgi:cytochrome c-type biogenesis protein CcmH/NrfG